MLRALVIPFVTWDPNAGPLSCCRNPGSPNLVVISFNTLATFAAGWVLVGNASVHPENVCMLPRWHSGKESVCQCRRHRRCGFETWIRKIRRRAWQRIPVFLPGKSNGQRSLVGYSPWGCRESDMTEWLTLYILIHVYIHYNMYYIIIVDLDIETILYII